MEGKQEAFLHESLPGVAVMRVTAAEEEEEKKKRGKKRKVRMQTQTRCSFIVV